MNVDSASSAGGSAQTARLTAALTSVQSLSHLESLDDWSAAEARDDRSYELAPSQYCSVQELLDLVLLPYSTVVNRTYDTYDYVMLRPQSQTSRAHIM